MANSRVSLFFLFLLLFSFLNEHAEARRRWVKRGGGGGGGGCPSCVAGGGAGQPSCSSCVAGGVGSGGCSSCVAGGGGGCSSCVAGGGGGGGCSNCVAGGSSSSPRLINQGNSRVVAVDGVRVPEGAHSYQWNNGRPQFLDQLGKDLSHSATDNTNPAATGADDAAAGSPARAVAPGPAKSGPNESGDARGPAAEDKKDKPLTEEETIVNRFIDAAPDTEVIAEIFAKLESDEMDRKWAIDEPINDTKDEGERTEKSKEALGKLKEAMLAKWSKIIEGLTRESEKSGDRRIKAIAKTLQNWMEESRTLFDKAMNEAPLDEFKAMNCVFCHHHHLYKKHLANAGFTTKQDEAPKFDGDFVSVKGKNYRLFIHKESGVPYYSERGLDKAETTTFAHKSPVTEAIKKYYDTHPMKGDKEKALVAALTAHLSNPNPVPPSPLVPKVVTSANSRGESLPSQPAAQPSTASVVPPVAKARSSQSLLSDYLAEHSRGVPMPYTADEFARRLNLSPFVRSGGPYGFFIDWNAIPKDRRSDVIKTLKLVSAGDINQYKSSNGYCLWCHLRNDPTARRMLGN